MAHTCINDLFGEAPKKRVLKGDKRKPEPGTHIIEFPGGAVEVSRLEDGSYWAHIIVNQKEALDHQRGTTAAIGAIVDSRVDWHERRLESIPGLPEAANLTQLAVRIMPQFPGEAA